MKFLSILLGICSIVIYCTVFLFLVYYIFLLYHHRCKSWFKKSESIRSIVIPMGGKLEETAFKDATIELNRKIKAKVSGNLNRIKSIATSIGPNGICYITVWYAVKGHSRLKTKSEAVGTFGVF